jgi:formamidase
MSNHSAVCCATLIHVFFFLL